MPRWWSRSRGLPPPVYDEWRASIAAHPGAVARILAWAQADSGYVVAGPTVLSVRGDEPGSDWLHVGWHEIESGGWNAETQQLRWVRYPELPSPRRGALTLTAAGRLPEIFRERVAASIVVERFLPIDGGRGVVLHGRRDLAAPRAGTATSIDWHATLGRGLTWRMPGLRRTVDESLAELRMEYDPGWTAPSPNP